MLVTRSIIGHDVNVICHNMKCHNCNNDIFGVRYNCDQMAAQV